MSKPCLIALLVLGGCALAPEQAASIPDLDLCRYVLYRSDESQVIATTEARRRGVDCNRFVATYQAEGQQAVRHIGSTIAETAEDYKKSLPKTVHCRSTVSPITGNVDTYCQ